MGRRGSRKTRSKKTATARDPRQLTLAFPQNVSDSSLQSARPIDNSPIESQTVVADETPTDSPDSGKSPVVPRQKRARMNDVANDIAARSIEDYPPLLTIQEAAALLRLQVSTVYRHVSEGRYRKAVRRGKPLRFYRDRLIEEFMQ